MKLKHVEFYTDDDKDFLLPPGTSLVTVLDVTPIGSQLRWRVVVTHD